MDSGTIGFSGKLDLGRNKVEVKLLLYLFEEDGSHIVFCPHLDLCSYGKTEEEAMESWKVVLAEYFLYTTNKKTLKEDLQIHGWSVKKKMIPPPEDYMLSHNPEFNRIYSTGRYRKMDYSTPIPA